MRTQMIKLTPTRLPGNTPPDSYSVEYFMFPDEQSAVNVLRSLRFTDEDIRDMLRRQTTVSADWLTSIESY